jgi:Voltage-dependent anion channel
MLYGLVMTLIFYRISFFPLSAEDFGPLSWIDAGAAVISALAGATLILQAPGWPILGAYLPFLRGATLSVWAAATFWLPFLVAMATWRYAMRRDRLRYEPRLLGMAFPVGTPPRPSPWLALMACLFSTLSPELSLLRVSARG